MKKVWIVAEAIISPLGITAHENFDRLRALESGICEISNSRLSPNVIQASLISQLEHSEELTRFENLALQAIEQAIGDLTLPSARTLFILSTTKGNIELLDSSPNHPRIAIHASAQHIASKARLENSMVISNACISGVMALLVAQRYLLAEKFDHAVVVGAEVLSKFIVSGFESLYALSPLPCKPFDKNRKGITLGEGAAAMILSTKPEQINNKKEVEILGGGLSNDANHISGPSRTGKELAAAITHGLQATGLNADDINLISAHGTGTLYNDEMEARAFTHAGLNKVPLNSLKGYFGHTLGAAGVIETIIAQHSLLKDEIIPTKGFENHGVSVTLNVADKLQRASMRFALKTASGFGGCNAALFLKKHKN
jgi:3-oxoacyl-[acyl-carrier-protein] synthase-1